MDKIEYKPKSFGDTYLYSKYQKYSEKLATFIIQGDRIDTHSEDFENIRTDIIRRQISNSLLKVLDSPSTTLAIGREPLPKPFKVFVAKDIKSNSTTHKVFIDGTGIIKFTDGKYVCNDADIIIAYLVSAQTNLVYWIDTKRIVMNSTLTQYATECFSSLCTYIVDYLAKISTVTNLRLQCLYLSSMYFLTHLLGRDQYSDSTRAIARKIAGISEREEDIIRVQIPDDGYDNIKNFVDTLGSVLRIENKISIDLICEKWMYCYGTGTVFGLELFTSFASMITDAYVGCYINNQKTIEKITGKSMVMFTKTLLNIGSESI